MKDIDAVMRHMKDLLVLSHKAKTAAELVLMHLFDASRNTKIEAAVQQIKAALTTGANFFAVTVRLGLCLKRMQAACM